MEHLLSLISGAHVMAVIIILGILAVIVIIKHSIAKSDSGIYTEQKATAELRVQKARALQNRELESLPQIVHTGVAEKE